MAYIPNYAYDIFISYAHIDNTAVFNQSRGWVKHFYEELNLALAQRIGRMDVIKIWMDNKGLDGSTLLDHTIEDVIKKSAIMICLTSPGYLESDYCRKEMSLFYQKAQNEPTGLKIGERSRILNVSLNNIHHTQLPKELKGTLGFPFHSEGEIDDLGDPYEIGQDEFKKELRQLRDALYRMFCEFKTGHYSPVASISPEIEEESDFSIYIGEVSDSLRLAKKRTITELEKKGYKVVYNIPPPFPALEHEKKVKAELQKVGLTVHLLDQNPGREVDGDETVSYPQKQAELGLQEVRSQIIWVPKELNVASIEEEKYRQFIEHIENGTQSHKSYEFIRGTPSTLAVEIDDFAQQLKKQRSQEKKTKEKLSVLLDTHFHDQLCAFDLGKNLIEHDIQPYINPQEDDPRKNINLLADRIGMVSKLIFFYGTVSKDWVVERMNAALQLILTNNYEVEDFFVFLAPPYKQSTDISLKQKLLKIKVINNSQDNCVSHESLDQLIKNLKGSQA